MTCNSAHKQTPLSNDTIDSVVRDREVGRAKDLSAPPRRLYYISHHMEGYYLKFDMEASLFYPEDVDTCFLYNELQKSHPKYSQPLFYAEVSFLKNWK